MPDNRDDRHENRAGAIDARLRELIGQPAVSEAYVRFRLDLLAAQRAARRALADPAAATRRPGDERAASLPVPVENSFSARVAVRLATAVNCARVVAPAGPLKMSANACLMDAFAALTTP